MCQFKVSCQITFNKHSIARFTFCESSSAVSAQFGAECSFIPERTAPTNLPARLSLQPNPAATPQRTDASGHAPSTPCLLQMLRRQQCLSVRDLQALVPTLLFQERAREREVKSCLLLPQQPPDVVLVPRLAVLENSPHLLSQNLLQSIGRDRRAQSMKEWEHHLPSHARGAISGMSPVPLLAHPISYSQISSLPIVIETGVHATRRDSSVQVTEQSFPLALTEDCPLQGFRQRM